MKDLFAGKQGGKWPSREDFLSTIKRIGCDEAQVNQPVFVHALQLAGSGSQSFRDQTNIQGIEQTTYVTQWIYKLPWTLRH